MALFFFGRRNQFDRCHLFARLDARFRRRTVEIDRGHFGRHFIGNSQSGNRHLARGQNLVVELRHARLNVKRQLLRSVVDIALDDNRNRFAGLGEATHPDRQRDWIADRLASDRNQSVPRLNAFFSGRRIGLHRRHGRDRHLQSEPAQRRGFDFNGHRLNVFYGRLGMVHLFRRRGFIGRTFDSHRNRFVGKFDERPLDINIAFNRQVVDF